MTGIHYTSPSGDGLCGGHHFDVMALRDSIVTSDGNELPRAGVKNVNVGIEGRAPLSIETCEMMDTTNVPVSTVFERFRNVRLNSFGSHYLSQSVSTVDERGCVHTSPLITGSWEETSCSRAICSHGVAGYVSSSSTIAPLNHAYLCLNVTDGVVRPEIVPFTNTRPVTTHEGNGYRENTRHTGGLFQQNEVFSITPMSDTSSLGTRSMRRSSTNGRTPSYIDLGDCDQQCRHCGCLFWYNERIRNNNCGRRVEYHLCCEGGKIYMRPTPDLPVFIQQFLTNSHFMEHIRAYNQMFAMTSFGAKVDDTVNNGKGPYVFKVSGQIYHLIGSLCPEEGHHSRFLQLYIYDTQAEVSNRMRNFGGRKEATLHPDIVEGLIHVLDEHNGLVRLFRTTRDRVGLIFKGGRLFQQYVVAAFCAIEQSHLDFIRKRQRELRSDYLLGLYDAISQGDREGIQAGSMVMLPRTFTGGPRYMYSHYLDSLAICRSVGNPQFFITFTCHVKWPEIKRYMLQFVGLTPGDRAYIVCRVFEQTVNDFLRFLKDERPFGYVIALEDPIAYKLITELMMHGTCGVANPSANMRLLRSDLSDEERERSKIFTQWLLGNDEIGYPDKDNDEDTFWITHVKEFGLPTLLEHLLKDLKNKLLMEEKNYRRDVLLQESALSIPKLNEEQKQIYNLIMNASEQSRKEMLFVYGHGGTGKTFLWKTISSSLRSQESYLCPHSKVCTLKQNMRLLRSDLSDEERERSKLFTQWLPGNDEIGYPDKDNDEDTFWITVPQEYCISPKKAIVCSKNEAAEAVNAKILASVKGVTKTYLNRDEAIQMERETSETEMLYLTEYLNTITFPGFLPHELQLKFTMFDDLAKQFNKQEIDKLPHPIIIAVSSYRVSKYKGGASMKEGAGAIRHVANATNSPQKEMASTPVRTTENKSHQHRDVMQKFKATARTKLPVELVNTIGKKHIFQIQFSLNTQKGAGRFIVNDVLDIEPTSEQGNAGTYSYRLFYTFICSGSIMTRGIVEMRVSAMVSMTSVGGFP
nr:helitron helicase-like domain-containing protein [Tanacetum cinerariifolium]